MEVASTSSWDSHVFSLYSLCVLDAPLLPTLCDSIDCSPPGSSVYRILQARILEWVAVSFSRGSSWPRNLYLLHHVFFLIITASLIFLDYLLLWLVFVFFGLSCLLASPIQVSPETSALKQKTPPGFSRGFSSVSAPLGTRRIVLATCCFHEPCQLLLLLLASDATDSLFPLETSEDGHHVQELLPGKEEERIYSLTSEEVPWGLCWTQGSHVVRSERKGNWGAGTCSCPESRVEDDHGVQELAFSGTRAHLMVWQLTGHVITVWFPRCLSD